MAKTKATKEIEPAVLPTGSGIVVNDAEILKPVAKPLIVVLPPDASKAQIARAKILNGYAYSNPKGWRLKKDRLIKELEALKDAPDPDEFGPTGPNLEIGRPIPSNILPA